jgi:hypothetical protein
MRATILSGVIAALLLAGPAQAAPTCQTRSGETIRCGTQNAMPVGWRIAPQERRADPLGGNGAALLKVALGLGLLLAFIALLPPFDGSRASDWDRQEGDKN